MIKLINWLAGDDDLPQIHKIYNTACFIAIIFCLMAAIESSIASLNPVLIFNNFFYSAILALAYYLSRVKHLLNISRTFSITVLLFIYTPLLWIYNGGSSSGIPYYIPLFFSFLIISITSETDTLKNKIFGGVILVVYGLIITVLLALEYFHPELFYVYSDQATRYVDIAVSMLFTLGGNFMILRAFIEQYYKHISEIKEYSSRLEDLVVRDSMTSLYNHAFIVNRLGEEVEKANRYLRPLSILMIDIDHFKKINDTYGHTFGDEVLIKIAHSIHSCCRSVDIPARYGGEEFLLVLPETNATSAVVVAQRLEKIILNLQFRHEITVTVSGGITQFQAGDTSLKMIERADTFLYEAKNAGRNNIKVGNS